MTTQVLIQLSMDSGQYCKGLCEFIYFMNLLPATLPRQNSFIKENIFLDTWINKKMSSNKNPIAALVVQTPPFICITPCQVQADSKIMSGRGCQKHI